MRLHGGNFVGRSLPTLKKIKIYHQKNLYLVQTPKGTGQSKADTILTTL